MSALAEAGTDQGQPCEQCGSPLAHDQEWCLECGSPRTLIHRPPDWRIAAAIIAIVAVLVLGGFAIALSNLSSDSNRAAAAAAKATATGTAPARTTSNRTAALAGWPSGQPGWTVVLFSSTDHASALAAAGHLRGSGLKLGLLNTSAHPSTNMKSGHWVVFTGRYPTRQQAQARARAIHLTGYRPRPRLVGLPGR